VLRVQRLVFVSSVEVIKLKNLNSAIQINNINFAQNIFSKMCTKLLFPSIRNLTIKKDTVDSTEMKHFKKLADEWWDDKGPLRALHSLNDLRIPLIRDRLIKIGATGGHEGKSVSVLDVGCGGGILVEALNRAGHNVLVTGVDANDELINVAKIHAKSKNLSLNYECTTIEEHAIVNAQKYDVVVSSETIEHVTEKQQFLRSCIQCLKPGGSLFMTTFNKTWLSHFAGIFLAENVFKCIPKGTHEYDKFIALNDLIDLLKKGVD
jgi:polyprenyldihydroxybenzoate methyltransferase/3-demethylubiquinol 3-O-methyltransferase